MRSTLFSRVCLAGMIYATPWNVVSAQTPSLAEQTATNRFYSEFGKWIKASNTNCLVWNSFPRPGETVTWSGAVREGKAHGNGIVQWLTNGVPTTRYEGEMKGGVADGHGTAIGSGERIEGEFKRGCLISNATIYYDHGGWYKGETKGGFKEGQGEELMAGNVKFVGRFKGDRFDGSGEMIWPNGDKIIGEWKQSKLEGLGAYVQRDGTSFKVQRTEKGTIQKVE